MINFKYAQSKNIYLVLITFCLSSCALLNKEVRKKNKAKQEVLNTYKPKNRKEKKILIEKFEYNYSLPKGCSHSRMPVRPYRD